MVSLCTFEQCTLNEYLASQSSSPAPDMNVELEQRIAELDTAFLSTKENAHVTTSPLILYRGCPNKRIQQGVRNAFLSATSNRDLAITQAGNNGVIYELRLDTGIRYLQPNTAQPCDILLPRNLYYSVQSTTRQLRNMICVMRVSVSAPSA